MRSFEARWQDGLEKFLNTHRNIHSWQWQTRGAVRLPQGGQPAQVAAPRRPRAGHVDAQARKMRALNRTILERAFSNSTFIYGTTGPTPLQYAKKGSGPIAMTVKHLFREQKANATGSRENDAARAITRFVRLLRRMRTFYDPGPRVNEYLRQGHQMMDMYFGMQGVTGNTFWRHRNDVIAEFVHYVMGYHQMGYHARGVGRTGIDYDPEMPGWRAFETHFQTQRKGWEANFYGPTQTATKEISKIIREGIRRFGGKLIFEGRQVYGKNIFSTAGTPRDTDLEALDLFEYFPNNPTAPTAPLGNGVLEFQWNGRPTVPTRAHFLSNWQWNGDHTHSHENQEKMWFNFLERAMRNGQRTEFRALWDKFENLPSELHGPTGVLGMIEAIRFVSARL